MPSEQEEERGAAHVDKAGVEAREALARPCPVAAGAQVAGSGLTEGLRGRAGMQLF